ncbi:MAG TPA: DeoR/GlpR family DNA-binding transcription regulator [Jatrophihabitans sp.]|nr:DeoR/GlpR family DNA-binding transcription regulator [Jatrophihabitans sp.]
MKRYARLNALLDEMAEHGHVDVEQMADRLQVSASTIRRDLAQLTEQQLVTRTRGGAVAAGVSYDLPMRYKASKHQPEQLRIGQAAARLVHDGDVVGLTGGATTTEVARGLAARGPAGPAGAITVVTNAVNIAGELIVRRNVTLLLLGGLAKPQSFDLVGPFATEMLGQLDLDVAMIGVDAIDPDAGVKSLDPDGAQVAKLMAARSRRTVVVSDSSKLHARALARICEWSQVQVLVTDTAAPAADLDRVRAHGVEVICA